MVVDVQQKMERNLTKAIDEHRKSSDCIMTYDHYLRSRKKESLVSVEIFKDEARGRRNTMEDAQSINWVGEQILAGLYDGHGGCRAAIFSSLSFARRFPQVLQDCQGSVHQTFMKLFPEIHAWYVNDKRNPGGTTALLLYIDEEKQTVTTATLGDSEAFLYRKIQGSYQALPLSCVRNWGSKSDARRVAIAYDKPTIEEEWPKASDPKQLRVMVGPKGREKSLNVSRAIGDRLFQSINERPLVIQKPKITEARFEQDDYIVAACDGVWDYLKHEEVIGEINALRDGDSLAKRITLRALDVSKDNISVIAFHVVGVKPH